MKTLLSQIKIGDRINSTNGKYYHTVQNFGKTKILGFGDYAIPVKTKCFSNSGRFVQNETIHFKNTNNGDFKTDHIN